MITTIINAVKDRIQGKIPLLSKRSSHWESVRKIWLFLNGECAACGSKEKLQVHHIKPFHIDPSLELDYNNFITLCEKKGGLECHLHIGHHGNFKQENPLVVAEAQFNRKNYGLPPLTAKIPANK